MRYALLPPLIVVCNLSVAAEPLADLIGLCAHTENEQVFGYRTPQLTHGTNVGVVPSPLTVSTDEEKLFQTCDWPQVRIIHCHLRVHGGGMLPSSVLPDGMRGDIKYLVYHENMCRARRKKLGIVNPIVHGVLVVPDRILTLYQLGPLLRKPGRQVQVLALSAQPGTPSSSTLPPAGTLSPNMAAQLYENVIQSYREQYGQITDPVPETVFRTVPSLFQVRTIRLP